MSIDLAPGRLCCCHWLRLSINVLLLGNNSPAAELLESIGGRMTVNRNQLDNLARKVLIAESLYDVPGIVRNWAKRLPGSKLKRGSFKQAAHRFADMLEAAHNPAPRNLLDDYALPHNIFVEGNSKLPFWSFSTIPGHDCPGAGDCLNWCYSFKAWRYPGSFFRQLQNSLLMRFQWGRNRILEAFHALPQNATLRLYVDGDFRAVSDIQFWFDNLAHREDIRAYGYSKSWQQFQDYARRMEAFDDSYAWPSNYALNLSSGSKHGAELKAFMAELPITRGEFVAITIDGSGIPRKTKDRIGNREYHKRVRESAKQQFPGMNVLSCPLDCSNCPSKVSKKGHACDWFDGVVAIGVH